MGVLAAALLALLAGTADAATGLLRRDTALRPPVLFLCRDAGETLAFLPVILILNKESSSASTPRAVALATTLNAAQRLSVLPAAAVLTWERLGLPGATDQRFLARNATLPAASLATLLSQLQVRLLLCSRQFVHVLAHLRPCPSQPEVVVTGLVSNIQRQVSPQAICRFL